MRHMDKLPCGTRTVRLLVEERRQAMKLTGSKSFLLGIALIMSFVGALGAGVMLGTA